jgi:tetratricopeptide (TPR) repeat protein
MKIIYNIILFICCFSVIHAEKKVENIKIINKNYCQIYIYLSETGTYDVKLSQNIYKLNLKNYALSKNFPGSEFGIKSDFLKKIYLTKGDSLGIIFNFSLNDETECIVQNYPESALIELTIYSNGKLTDAERIYIKALKFESEGEKEKALIEYRRLLSNNPNHSDALFHAGLLRKSLGYNYQSKSNFIQAKKIGNTVPELSYQLSETYKNLNDDKNYKKESEYYTAQITKQREDKFDSSSAEITRKDLSNLQIDSLFHDKTVITDSINVLAKTKPLERKIIKTIPVNSSSYYYSLAANILVGLVAVGSVIYIIRLLRKKRSKENQAVIKNKKKRIDLKENLAAHNETAFQKLVTGYKNELDEYSFDSAGINYQKKEKDNVYDNNQKINSEVRKEANPESDIDRLAKKYQVERGKIELALKIIAKNDTESTKDKYLLLMKMLKENMSLEDLASGLRIPRGELELVMNLKNI